MWGEEICPGQYVIGSVDVFSVEGKDSVGYTLPHIGSHSPNNNRCIHLSDCISSVVCCDQRIGSRGALETCSWFLLLRNEI